MYNKGWSKVEPESKGISYEAIPMVQVRQNEWGHDLHLVAVGHHRRQESGLLEDKVEPVSLLSPAPNPAARGLHAELTGFPLWKIAIFKLISAFILFRA